MPHMQLRSFVLQLPLLAGLLMPTPRAAAAQGADAPVVAPVVVDSAEAARVAATAAASVAAAAAALDSAVLADSVQEVARLLVANGAPERRAHAVAAAVMRYARLRGLDPLLVVGVIGVENAELVSRARSSAGARGVMQVMPSWKKDIRECVGDMHDVVVNVCLGTAVLRIALDASESVREALLRYNGCVRAPGCTRYATAVFGRAGHALLMSRLASRPTAPVAASTPAAPSAPARARATTLASAGGA